MRTDARATVTAMHRLSPRIVLAFALGTSWLACGDGATPPSTVIDGSSDEAPPSTDDAGGRSEATVDATIDATADASVDVLIDRVAPDRQNPSDRNSAPDMNAGIECRALAINRGSMPPDGICPADAGMPPFRRYACLPPPESGTCEDAYSEACVLNTYLCLLSERARGIVCGPLVDTAGQCCYVTWGDCLID